MELLDLIVRASIVFGLVYVLAVFVIENKDNN